MFISLALMHIPDGFLSISVSGLLWIVTISVIGYAINRVGKDLGEKQIPLMGVMAAFIFAAQMINFPIAGGTSGHLLGGTLAAITLGPWGGILVMTSVIIVQGLLFQDGGLLVMGANIINMGILTVIVGYGLYRMAAGRKRSIRLADTGIAAWLSVMTGALAASLELWLSGTARLDIVLPAMLSVHALIGIGEALITVAALAFILRSRPDLIENKSAQESGGRGWVAAGLLVSLVVVLLAPLASTHPDGLERVALDMGFFGHESGPLFNIFPNYALPFLGKTSLSTVLSGILGAAVVAALTVTVIRLLRRPAQSHSKIER
jgi:cobalt/nickel transport system permease protein